MIGGRRSVWYVSTYAEENQAMNDKEEAEKAHAQLLFEGSKAVGRKQIRS
jgi:hypothetical protein